MLVLSALYYVFLTLTTCIIRKVKSGFGGHTRWEHACVPRHFVSCAVFYEPPNRLPKTVFAKQWIVGIQIAYGVIEMSADPMTLLKNYDCLTHI